VILVGTGTKTAPGLPSVGEFASERAGSVWTPAVNDRALSQLCNPLRVGDTTVGNLARAVVGERAVQSPVPPVGFGHGHSTIRHRQLDHSDCFAAARTR